jgi:single-strand DNA-binding protein
MANEQMITIRGRMVGDPEMRFTPSGAAVVNFTIAANARKFDKNTNEWKDKDAIFWRCSAWRELAENIAESLTKGMAVVAFVELESRSYEKDGQTRTVTEARVEAIGPDLRWATAKVTKAQRSQQGGGQQQGGFGGQQGQGFGGGFGGQPQPGAQNPNAGGWGNPGTDEPPF